MEFDPSKIRKGIEQQLCAWLDAGIEQIPDVMQDHFVLPEFALNGVQDRIQSPDPVASVESAATEEETLLDIRPTPIDKPYSAPLDADKRASALQVLQNEVAACTRCDKLARSRTQTVFGVGDPNCRLCFVGEAPGADEDRQGEPFVGAAGQLLTRIIEACKLTREQVYILNVLKCRPPNNRNPNGDEIENCWNFATKQLDILQPEFICCLGSFAARTLLQTDQSVGRMRQKFFQYRDSKVIVTYHPSYLLRTPSAKRQVWDDMKMLMNEMGVEL